MQREKERYGCWNYKRREWEKGGKGINEREREKERWQKGREGTRNGTKKGKAKRRRNKKGENVGKENEKRKKSLRMECSEKIVSR
jgi:hypothetical protein